MPDPLETVIAEHAAFFERPVRALVPGTRMAALRGPATVTDAGRRWVEGGAPE
ncbi:hypothetical protein [Saltatorellus ferox]|uniref:hypothetical protein n=1 Tax=Saltatorellus ferox TaxID=2528018 RepID=UPI003AF3A67C